MSKVPADLIPPLRADIVVKRMGKQLVAEDAARRVRIPLDSLALEVMQALSDGPQRVADLRSAVSGDAADIWRRVTFLTRHALLETPRAATLLKMHHEAAPSWQGESLADAPLLFPAGLAHGCVACGACCHGTHVGPLTPGDIARVKEIDWTEHIPDLSRDSWFIETDGPHGKPITLLGMRKGRCVFLGENKLCTIHSVAGAAQKPGICRQFPYTFTRTPDGLSVSFSMECRAWWEAKQNAGPIEDEEAALRTLLAQQVPVLEVPNPIPVWTGADLAFPRWNTLRQEAIDAVRAATDTPSILAALVGLAHSAYDAPVADYRSDEVYAARGTWALEDETRPAAESYAHARSQLASALGEGITQIAAHVDGRGDVIEGDRIRRFKWAVNSLLSGRRVDDLVRFEHELEIWRDMVLAALYGHQPARRGDLLTGLAVLALQLLAGELLAGLLAEVARRGRVAEQDVVDAMVLVTKELRGSAFTRLIAKHRTNLVSVVLYNGAVFAGGQTPTATEEL